MERYYTIAEVSEQTGIPRRTLYDAIKAGRLRAVTPSGSRRGMRVRAEWVEEWLSHETARR